MNPITKKTSKYRDVDSEDDALPASTPRTLPVRTRRESRTSDRPSERFHGRERSPSVRRRRESSHDRYAEQPSSPPTEQNYQLRNRQEMQSAYPPARGYDERPPSPLGNRPTISADPGNRDDHRSYGIPENSSYETQYGDDRSRYSTTPTAPRAATNSDKLFPKLGLPDDVLKFIQLPLNAFEDCSAFVSKHSEFISSIEVSWFDDAALEAAMDKNYPLMHQCLQRRIIVNQIKGNPNQNWRRWLTLLAQREKQFSALFYQTFNGLVNSIQAKVKSATSESKSTMPSTSYHSTLSTVPISSNMYMGPTAQPIISSGSNWHAPAPGTDLDPRYPISASPFNRHGLDQTASGQPAPTSYQAAEPPWQPITSVGQPVNPQPQYQPRYHRGHYNSQSIGGPNYTVQGGTSSQGGGHPPHRRPRLPSGSANDFQGVSTTSGSPPGRTPGVQEEEDLTSWRSTKLAKESVYVSASQFGDPEPLDPKYSAQNGRTFFVTGRVFAMMYPEPKGNNRRGNQRVLDTGPDDSGIIYGHRGEEIFSHIKRFVVIRARRGHCLCVPINSYRRTGVGKKGIPPDEKSAHAIIYDSRKKPSKPILPGEEDLVKNPIAVDMKQGDTLEPTSRVHFGKIYTIEWNVKVYGIGSISPHSVDDVEEYWREELTR